MKKELGLIASVFAATLCFGQTNLPTVNVEYDSTLAKKLGADEYGMKEYVMVILNTGTTQVKDRSERNKIISAHMKTIDNWTKDGKLLFAGPFMQENEMQEIFILQVKSIEEAKKLADTDPAVSSGLYSVEYHLWYGPAALQEITPLNKALQKKKLS
jgi:uncharacterized protein YciI